MNKAELKKLVEQFAHLVNAIRYDNQLAPKYENKFWELVEKLPEDIKQSVIN